MATSINYGHVKMTINLTSIINQVDSYISALLELNQTILPLIRPEDSTNGKYYYETNIEWLYKVTYNQTLKVIALHLGEAEEIKWRVKSLQRLLPQPVTTDDHHVRGKRIPFLAAGAGLLAGLVLGIFGTYQGSHNAQQIKYLLSQDQLQKQLNQKFIEVTQLHDRQIQEISHHLDAVTKYLHVQTQLNPGLLDSRLSRLESQMYNRIHIATHAIQEAQQHRLAIDLIPHFQLEDLFEKLQRLAKSNGCELLLEHPSDLFQIEVSYFSFEGDVYLLLHVPMVAPESTLRLFKLHPFPLPIYNKATEGPLLVPEVENNVLGISTGSQRYSVQLSAVELLSCHIVNRKYTCEKSGVLKKQFADTCLGALYHQQLEAAKKICTLRLHPAEEMVRQLKNNWFAVFLPKQITVPIQCRNGTSKELMMPTGVSSFHLSEGCTASLNDHLVTSDFSVQTPSDFIHYEWKWDSTDLMADGLDKLTLIPELKTLSDHGIHYPTLDAVQELYIQKQYSPGWWAHLVHFVGLGTITLILIATIIFLIVRFRARLVSLRRLKQLEVPSSPLDDAIHEIEMRSLSPEHQLQANHFHLLRQQRNERERLKPSVASFPDDDRLYPVK